jgi:hypothetical protein
VFLVQGVLAYQGSVSGECTSVASSQGALVSQDTLKVTHVNQKPKKTFDIVTAHESYVVLHLASIFLSYYQTRDLIGENQIIM